MEINHAEVHTIHRALKIMLSYRISFSSVIVESYSFNAVGWCNGECEAPWCLAFIINFIRSTLLS